MRYSRSERVRVGPGMLNINLSRARTEHGLAPSPLFDAGPSQSTGQSGRAPPRGPLPALGMPFPPTGAWQSSRNLVPPKEIPARRGQVGCRRVKSQANVDVTTFALVRLGDGPRFHIVHLWTECLSGD